MKRTTFFLMSLLVIGTSFSQNRNDLKGPAAKNYKPWKDNVLRTVNIESKHPKLKGSKAKNYKHWKK